MLLDAALERPPHAQAASLLINNVEQRSLIGFVAGTSLTTCYYVIEKQSGANSAEVTVQRLLRLFEVAPITREVLKNAFDLGFRDYEDAVLHEAARLVSAVGIVTSNTRDFSKATLQILTPEELLSSLDG